MKLIAINCKITSATVRYPDINRIDQMMDRSLYSRLNHELYAELQTELIIGLYARTYFNVLHQNPQSFAYEEF